MQIELFMWMLLGMVPLFACPKMYRTFAIAGPVFLVQFSDSGPLNPVAVSDIISGVLGRRRRPNRARGHVFRTARPSDVNTGDAGRPGPVWLADRRLGTAGHKPRPETWPLVT